MGELGSGASGSKSVSLHEGALGGISQTARRPADPSSRHHFQEAGGAGAGPGSGGTRGASPSPSWASGTRLARWHRRREQAQVARGQRPDGKDAREARGVAPVPGEGPRSSPAPPATAVAHPDCPPLRGLTEALSHRGAERVPQEELHLERTTRQRPGPPVSRPGPRCPLSRSRPD